MVWFDEFNFDYQIQHETFLRDQRVGDEPRRKPWLLRVALACFALALAAGYGLWTISK